MRTLRVLIVALAMLSVCSVASAQAFFEDFESYDAGSGLHGKGGWAGWDDSSGAGAPASDDFAYSGSNSVEIVPAADLVHIFDITAGQWVLTANQYIPSGGTGETYFILLNTYSHGGTQNWSTQTRYNLATGAITTWTGAVTGTSVAFDQWVELKYVIDLNENTVDEYYNGTLIDSRVWDTDNHNTLQCIDLFANSASSVYYDNILIMSPGAANPADGDADAPRDVILSWPGSQYAESYNVYFGTSLEDVEAGDPSVLVSEGQAGTSFDPEGLLDYAGVYYWRLDGISPAGTVYTIGVWSFQAEPFVYPIENIIATSNTIPDAGAVPENAVNGSGLNENDEHSKDAADMWLGAPEGADPVYIQFEFDRIYKLYEMLVWNYNGEFEAILAFGIKDVTVEYAEDGETWTALGDVTLAQGTASADYTANTTIDLEGVPAKFVRMTVNSGYGMFGSFGLSEVRILHKPVQARKPQPADEATGVDLDGVLSWSAGREAASHEVYLNTDEAAVADGTALVATVTESNYSLSGLDVEYGATYYWKVNEVNEAEEISTWEGEIWSFTAAAYAVVDDFETYDDEDNRIYSSWVDGYEIPGNGSTVGNLGSPFAEQTIVNNGGQSMPLFYDNVGATIAEAELTLAKDWTANGIKTLSLSFHGAAGNGGQLYVKINGTKVAYDGDTADLARVAWQPWNIDLSAVGGNLSNVTSLIIGIEGAGAAGVVYIDDVRLYPKLGELVVPTEPGADGLVASLSFDESSGTTAADGSGNNNHGDVMGDAQWVAGKVGGALAFDGVDDMVVVNQNSGLPIYNNGTDNAYSITMWVKGGPQNDMRVFSEGSTTSGTPLFNLGTQNAGATGQFDVYIRPTGMDHTYSVAEPFDDTWHHIAWVDENGAARLYVDGLLDGGDFNYTRATLDLNTTTIGGILRAAPSHFFTGQIDEVRIYNRALSAGEILWLAGKTAPVHKPF